LDEAAGATEKVDGISNCIVESLPAGRQGSEVTILMELDKKISQEKTREFVKKYWPSLIVAGTVVGATVWLVAHYIKQRKIKDSPEFNALSELESEALSSTDETSILLETGSHLTKIMGREIKDATEELSQHLDNEKAKSTLSVLNQIEMSQSRNKKNTPAV
jgi:hypothetical protein